MRACTPAASSTLQLPLVSVGVLTTCNAICKLITMPFSCVSSPKQLWYGYTT